MLFVAYYVDFGNLPKVGEKAGLVLKEVEVTKEKNGLVFFKAEGETGERKISKNEMNKIRDFGNSLYGVFENNISKKEALDLIYDKLASRILETDNIMLDISSLFEWYHGKCITKCRLSEKIEHTGKEQSKSMVIPDPSYDNRIGTEIDNKYRTLKNPKLRITEHEDN